MDPSNNYFMDDTFFDGPYDQLSYLGFAPAPASAINNHFVRTADAFAAYDANAMDQYFDAPIYSFNDVQRIIASGRLQQYPLFSVPMDPAKWQPQPVDNLSQDMYPDPPTANPFAITYYVGPNIGPPAGYNVGGANPQDLINGDYVAAYPACAENLSNQFYQPQNTCGVPSAAALAAQTPAPRARKSRAGRPCRSGPPPNSVATICSDCGVSVKNMPQHQRKWCTANPNVQRPLDRTKPCTFPGCDWRKTNLGRHQLSCKRNPNRIAHRSCPNCNKAEYLDESKHLTRCRARYPNGKPPPRRRRTVNQAESDSAEHESDDEDYVPEDDDFEMDKSSENEEYDCDSSELSEHSDAEFKGMDLEMNESK